MAQSHEKMLVGASMKHRCVAILLWLFLTPTFAFQQPHTASTKEGCRLITAVDLFDAQAPTFQAYPAIREKIINPKLDLASSPMARTFRTVLRQGVAKGPNFAGHYRVVVWGCGSSCASFAVVDLKTGRVINPPDWLGAISGVHFEAEDFLPNTESDDTLFRYRSDSKLIGVIGAMDEDESKKGAFYFVMQDDQLVSVHSTLVKKNCTDAR